ncbi:unnamed protein product [Phyllotreta striolata]|uniref:DNA/RNA non-specific endonuclease n=1 Tax=Phyllotreta striolata TaxID=444603 RepID=A0A9N9U163_PHYSR|nr:unnamed protein product [Phyllotreta striolata]
MACFKFVLTTFYLLALFWGASAKDCLIDIKKLQQNHPLFLTQDSNDLIYPVTQTSTISFNTRDSFELECPGSGKVKAEDQTFGEKVVAKCLADGVVGIENQRFNVSEVECTRKVSSTARYTKNTCWSQHSEIEVGFKLASGKFIRVYNVCFDEETRNVVYSTFNMTRDIGYQTAGNTRPAWSEGKFYKLPGVKMDELYNNDVQRQTINRQLGLPEEDTSYVKPHGTRYLARGHLTAKADFMYNAEQQATFHYINSAPQWQSFNARNWFYLERNLRNFVAEKYIDVLVYTGTYGALTLPHASTGEETDVYFYFDSNGERFVPIPELFWKVAYDPVHRAGVAVIGLNNPYQTDISASLICTNIADKISWLNFDIDKPAAGYMYACDVDEFRKAVRDFPDLDIKKLLT